MHPYHHYKEAEEEEGYCLSNYDKKDLKENSDFWSRMGYKVCLLLTIAGLKKAGTKEPDWKAYNCIEFTLKTVRVWLSAYVTYFDPEKRHLVYSEYEPLNKENPLVVLDCPSLTGFIGEYVEYGQIILKKRKVVYKPAEE